MTYFFKWFKVFLLGILLTSFILESAHSQSSQNKFGFKLSGGLSYLEVGDLNNHNTDWNNTRRRTVEAANGTIISESQELHWGGEITVDLLFYIQPKFALCIGTGFIHSQLRDDVAEAQTGNITALIIHDIKVTAVPLRTGGHIAIPISSKTSFTIDAGFGYYLSKFNKFYRREPGDGYWIDNDFTGKSSGFGYDGGIGFEYNISKNISFVFEGKGRYANISGIEGSRDRIDSNEWGDLIDAKFYSFEREREPGIWSRIFNVYDNPPSGDDIRNIEDGALDFSGFNIKVGLNFGLF